MDKLLSHYALKYLFPPKLIVNCSYIILRGKRLFIFNRISVDKSFVGFCSLKQHVKLNWKMTLDILADLNVS